MNDIIYVEKLQKYKNTKIQQNSKKMFNLFDKKQNRNKLVLLYKP